MSSRISSTTYGIVGSHISLEVPVIRSFFSSACYSQLRDVIDGEREGYG